MLSVRFLVVDDFPGGPSGCWLDSSRWEGMMITLCISVLTCCWRCTPVMLGCRPGHWDGCQSHLRGLKSQTLRGAGRDAGEVGVWKVAPNYPLFPGKTGLFLSPFLSSLTWFVCPLGSRLPSELCFDTARQSLPFTVSTVTCWGAGTLAYVKYFSKQ